MSIKFYRFTMIVSFLLFSATILFAKVQPSEDNNLVTNKHLAVMYNVEGNVEDKYNKFVEHKIETIGYKLTDPHKRVNDVYKKKYGSTNLDILSFMSIANEDVVKPLFNIDPRIAAFNPFNMLIYKKLDDKKYHIGHLSPEAILDMVGIKDKSLRKTYIKSFEPLDSMMEKEFGVKKSYIDYKKLADKTMMNFELTFDRPEDISDFIDEFQEKFEEKFEAKDYIIAGFNDFKESDGKDTIPNFDAFWTYSLCQFTFSYTVFDNEGGRPAASLFAPCTMYMFIPKGSNKLFIGMPRLGNWKATLGITDKVRSKFMDKLDQQIPEILVSMGAVETENVNPLTLLKEEQAVVKKVLPTKAKKLTIANKKLAHMYVFDKNIEAKYNKFVEEKINTIGFKLTDPHKRVNDVYKKKYGKTNLDILSFMSIANEKNVKPLFNIDPRIAGFNPFNLLIYKKLNDKKTYVGHLTAEAILDMIGITDEKVRSSYIKSMATLDSYMKKELGGKEEYIAIKSLPKDRMMNFEIPFDKKSDIDDVIDDVQETFEETFESNGFIIAGFNDFKDSEGKDTIPNFDAFWTYSLCQFTFSYTVFDNDGGRPAASLFAPCTMYMYIKKGTHKIIVGMPKLANWKSTLGITDKVRSDFIDQLDKKIPDLMKKLGAIEIENTNPLISIVPKQQKALAKVSNKVAKVNKAPTKVTKKSKVVAKVVAPVIKTSQPTSSIVKVEKKVQKNEERVKNGYKITLPSVPKPVLPLNVITVGGSDIHYTSRDSDHLDHGIVFSSRVPPSEGDAVDKGNDGTGGVGAVDKGRISAYLRGAFLDTQSAKAKLESVGFKIVAITPVNKKGTLTTIVFTDENLQKLAQQKDSGFVGSLRLLVDKEDNQISISNPLYFAKAFMGEKFDEATAQKVLAKIVAAFKGLTNSTDKLKFTLLPKYRFMTGMPYYSDMVEIGKAGTTKALVAKLQKNKNLIFLQQITPELYIAGVKLDKRTSKFIKKIGYKNASLLPYPVLIEKGVAKILDPKYYISINYPMLKMSNFMKIATIPGAIQSNCEKLFN